MSTFDEIQFPTDVDYQYTGGPKFNTRVLTGFSGWEQRFKNWSKARLEWNVAKSVQSQTLVDAIIAFFNNRFGKAVGFRFKDWSDYVITNQNIGTGTGAALTFQIYKRYTSTNNYDRTIKKLVAATVLVYVNAVLKVEGANPGGDYTVGYNTGIITFNAGKAPPNGQAVNVTCEFDVPVRFDTDKLDLIYDAYDSYSISSLPIVEIRIA